MREKKLFYSLLMSVLFLSSYGMDSDGIDRFREGASVVRLRDVWLSKMWKKKRMVLDEEEEWVSPNYDSLAGSLQRALLLAYPTKPLPRKFVFPTNEAFSDEEAQRRLGFIMCYAFACLNYDFCDVSRDLTPLSLGKIRLLHEIFNAAARTCNYADLLNSPIPQELVECYPVKYKRLLQAAVEMKAEGADVASIARECLIKTYVEEFERYKVTGCFEESIMYWEILGDDYFLKKYADSPFEDAEVIAQEYVDMIFADPDRILVKFDKAQNFYKFLFGIYSGLTTILNRHIKVILPKLYSRYEEWRAPESEAFLDLPTDTLSGFYTYLRSTCQKWANLQGTASLGLEGIPNDGALSNCIVETKS